MTFAVRAIWAISLVVGASVPGLSREAPPRALATPVLEDLCQSASTQAETLSCYVAAAAESRAEVERVLKGNLRTAMALDKAFAAFARSHHSQGSSLAAQLNAAQAAWLRYAKSQCAFEGGSSFGGSGEDILEAACHCRLNSLRLRELKAADRLLRR